MLSPELRERVRVVCIKAARAVIDAYYASGNPTGGYLHVVTDDGGVGDRIIQGCIDEANQHAGGEAEAAAAIGEMLLAFPVEDRRLICADFRDPELVALIDSLDCRKFVDVPPSMPGLGIEVPVETDNSDA